MDDLKISHKKESVVKDIIRKLEDEYGKLSVTTGNIHTYCGMDLIFSEDHVEIDMVNYVKEVISEFGVDKCGKKVNSPAALHLFNVDPNQLALAEEDKVMFHKIVAKLLFVNQAENHSEKFYRSRGNCTE